MSRKLNLQKLEDKATNKLVAHVDGQPFLDAVQRKIDRLKDAIDTGLSINDIQELMSISDSIERLAIGLEQLKEITDTVKSIKFPETIELGGTSEVIKQLQKIKIEPIIKSTASPLDAYQIVNSDKPDAVNTYHGFVHETGKWYILWINGISETMAYKYAAGKDNYARSWQSRKTLSYKRFDEINL